MKKYISKMAVAVVAISMTLTSCTRKQEVYSCNRAVNSWATKTREVNQSISRAELSTLSLDSQMAVFRSLSDQNRYRIFQEKLQTIIDDSRYTAAEKTYIQQGYAYFQPSMYAETADTAAINAFYSNWANTGVTNFSWDRQKVFYIAETWMTPTEFEAMVGAPPAGGSDDCTCRSDWYCGSWSGNTCDKGNCHPTRGGCGWLGNMDCSGKCSWEKHAGGGSGGGTAPN